MNEIKWDENFYRKEYRYFEILYVVGKFVSDFNSLGLRKSSYPLFCSALIYKKRKKYGYNFSYYKGTGSRDRIRILEQNEKFW